MDELVEEPLAPQHALKPEYRDLLFGTPSATRRAGKPEHPWRVANEPEHALLIFSDLVTDKVAPDTSARTQRIKIDPDLGSVREGHLLFVECPFPFGDEVVFKGDVLLWQHKDADLKEVVSTLKKAAKRVFAIGGMKSVGFGRIDEFSVHNPILVAPATVNAPGKFLSLSYTVDRPFIVNTERHSGNLSVGSDVITGSTIKAMLARGLNAVGAQADSYLSEINIGHASPNERKPLPLSLSRTTQNNEDWVYCNLGQEDRKGYQRYSGNWKGDEEKQIRQALGEDWLVSQPSTSGRSRTAIEDSTLTSKFVESENEEEGEGLLFSQVAVVPDDTVWRGAMTAPDDLAPLQQILGILAAGLPGLGKTGAVLTGTAQTRSLQKVPSGTLNLTLTSDACLFLPQDAVGSNVSDLYRAYFKDKGLTLKSYYAAQVLKGGYLALRYPAQKGTYMPWVLTKAGSVFSVEPDAGTNVDALLVSGLEPAAGLSRDWREFPFLPENGFGHVVHDIVDHAALSRGLKL